ncbi:MAG TPA: hypothetical protein VEG62_04940, partial [Acidimicrobiales bacterium]|nr:hypothetical protein [Acidimicrobiales bacterium]
MRIRQSMVVGVVGVLISAVSVAGVQSVAAGAVPHALTTSTASLAFDAITLGTYEGPSTFTLTYSGTGTDTFDATTDLQFSGPGADDYLIVPDNSGGCPYATGTTVSLTGGEQCTMDVYFYPGALGDRSASVTIDDTESSGVTISLSGSGTIGYYQVDSQGNVAYAGDAAYYGDIAGAPLNKPIVAITPTGDDGGYWLVASDGGIFSYGDAGFYGSTGNLHLNQPIVGMARTSDAGGYWLVASDGGIFAYGDAGFYGS